jgi:hypothetical protein
VERSDTPSRRRVPVLNVQQGDGFRKGSTHPSAGRRQYRCISSVKLKMPTLEFDERKLLTELEQLTDRLRAAFAAACAERQFQCYVRYSEISKNGDHHKLARALGCIWEDLGKAQADHTALERQLEVCMSLLPSGESEKLGDGVFAENAVASVAFAIRARITESAKKPFGPLGELMNL